MRREDDVRRRNKWIDGTNDLFNISDHSHQWARHSADQCNVNKKERATLSGSVSATANVVKAAINTRAFIMLVSIIVNVCLLAAVKWMDEKLMDICDLIAIVSPFYTLYYLFFFLSLVFLLFFRFLLLSISPLAFFISFSLFVSLRFFSQRWAKYDRRRKRCKSNDRICHSNFENMRIERLIRFSLYYLRQHAFR